MAEFDLGSVMGKQGSDGVSVTGFESGTPVVGDDKTATPITATFSNGKTSTFNVYATNGSGGGDSSGSTIKIYGVRIDTTNPDPQEACEYTDNAVGMLPAAGNDGSFYDGGWMEVYPFNQIKPCLLKDGVVVGYLNPDNFTQLENGDSADIVSGESGDVMIEIPKFYYKIARNGNYIDVKISNVLIAGYTDYAFRYKGVSKDKFYIGAYLGSVDGTLRSISSSPVTTNETLGSFRDYAQAKGAGYEQLSFNKLTALQVLYLIMFKNLDSQTALGEGYTSTSFDANTGATNDVGMTYGSSDGNDHVKFLGIEDFWGNALQWVDGFVASDRILISDGNFNDYGEDYSEQPGKFTESSGYISNIGGDNITGFMPTSFDGSESTYFCDYGALFSGCVPVFGGSRSSGASAGAFRFSCNCIAAWGGSAVGARLCFCG